MTICTPYWAPLKLIPNMQPCSTKHKPQIGEKKKKKAAMRNSQWRYPPWQCASASEARRAALGKKRHLSSAAIIETTF